MSSFTSARQTICMTLWLACAAVAHAQQQPPQGKEGAEGDEHRKPPAEALAACKSLAAGSACNFTSPRGAETGTCGAPEGKPLACRPAHKEGQGKGKEKPKS